MMTWQLAWARSLSAGVFMLMGTAFSDGLRLLYIRPRRAAFLHRPEHSSIRSFAVKGEPIRVCVEAASVDYRRHRRVRPARRGCRPGDRVAAVRHDDRLCQREVSLGTIAGAGRTMTVFFSARVREGFGRARRRSSVAGSAAGSPNDRNTLRSILILDLINQHRSGPSHGAHGLQPALLFARCFPRLVGWACCRDSVQQLSSPCCCRLPSACHRCRR